MSLKRVVRACLVAGVATQVAIVGTAAAAPVNAKKASVIPVFCSDNNSYDVVTISNSGGNSGHQGFNAAHILGGSVFIPVNFPTVTGTFTDDTTSTLLETFNGGGAKGNGHATPSNGATYLTCSFSFTQSFVAGPHDKGLTPGDMYTFAFSGTVIGFIPSTKA